MLRQHSRFGLLLVATGLFAFAASAQAVTEISMLYSSEKKEWVEAAAQAFQKEHQEIKITLKELEEEREAVKDLLKGERPA